MLAMAERYGDRDQDWRGSRVCGVRGDTGGGERGSESSSKCFGFMAARRPWRSDDYGVGRLMEEREGKKMSGSCGISAVWYQRGRTGSAPPDVR